MIVVGTSVSSLAVASLHQLEQFSFLKRALFRVINLADYLSQRCSQRDYKESPSKPCVDTVHILVVP